MQHLKTVTKETEHRQNNSGNLLLKTRSLQILLTKANNICKQHPSFHISDIYVILHAEWKIFKSRL